MPSPFPGMDPYLEDPAIWRDVHHEMISEIRRRLAPSLRPRFITRIKERVYVSTDRDPGRKVIVPDINVVYSSLEPYVPAEQSGTYGTECEPFIATTLIDDEIREPYLTILDSQSREVITVIEVLSPTNKFPNAEGQKQYLEKRRDVMLSQAHLVEIDLLRAGDRIACHPELPPCDYVIHISLKRQRPKAFLWGGQLPQPLPSIPVPLREDAGDVPVDLQAALTSIYDRAHYDRSIDYTKPPRPPLTDKQQTWIETVLAEHRGSNDDPPQN